MQRVRCTPSTCEDATTRPHGTHVVGLTSNTSGSAPKLGRHVAAVRHRVTAAASAVDARGAGAGETAAIGAQTVGETQAVAPAASTILSDEQRQQVMLQLSELIVARQVASLAMQGQIQHDISDPATAVRGEATTVIGNELSVAGLASKIELSVGTISPAVYAASAAAVTVVQSRQQNLDAAMRSVLAGGSAAGLSTQGDWQSALAFYETTSQLGTGMYGVRKLGEAVSDAQAAEIKVAAEAAASSGDLSQLIALIGAVTADDSAPAAQAG